MAGHIKYVHTNLIAKNWLEEVVRILHLGIRMQTRLSGAGFVGGVDRQGHSARSKGFRSKWSMIWSSKSTCGMNTSSR